MRTTTLLALSAACFGLSEAGGQVLDTRGGGGGPTGQPSSPNPALEGGGGGNGGGRGGNNQVLGNDVPFLDPGSETVMWDGKSWNVTDQRVFEARFEKYLAAPTADSVEDQVYRDIIRQITTHLNPPSPSLPQAVALLPAAAECPIDARLCETLANAVYGAWQGSRNVGDMNLAIEEMGRTRRNLSRNWEIAVAPNPLDSAEEREADQANGAAGAAVDFSAAAIYGKEILELETKVKMMQAEIAVDALRNKIEFQGMIVQFFLQRRFEHVIISCRMYRQLFRDGDSTLTIEEGSDVDKMFSSGLGVNPTINTLDSFASEAIRDVDESLEAVGLLLDNGEMDTAANRLSEAFLVGEYLPGVRRLEYDKKRAISAYVRNLHQLRSALEVKDYTLAEELTEALREAASDFDYSKPRAMIETARTVSRMHINKAKVAAMNGDGDTVTVELGTATQIWPTNPALTEVSDMIADAGDIQAQTKLDFDRLYAQKNYRQIFMEQGRYAGAVLGDPVRQDQLAEIIQDVTKVNMVVESGRSLAQDGYHHAAWEQLRSAADDFPDDNEISRMLTELTTQVPEFVRAVQRAEQLEDRGQLGSSLAWYLSAKKMHPSSKLADSGQERVVALLRSAASEAGGSSPGLEYTPSAAVAPAAPAPSDGGFLAPAPAPAPAPVAPAPTVGGNQLEY